MGFENYKIIVYLEEDGTFVAEIPCLPACYALSKTKSLAVDELRRVFNMLVDEYHEKGIRLPEDSTEIINV